MQACSSSSPSAPPPASLSPTATVGGRDAVRQGREVDRIPGLCNRFGADRQRGTEKLALRDALSKGFRTEFFIKTGLVLLGASINLKLLVTAAAGDHPGTAADLHRVRLHLVAGRPAGLDDKLRALLASAVSICGVSAAIAAAGAVQAKREHSPTPHRWSSCSRCRRSSCCRGSPTCSVSPTRLPARGSAATSTPPRRSRPRRDRRRGRAEDRHDRQDHPERVDRHRSDRADRLLRAEGRAQSADEARPTLGEFWERFPKFVLGFVAASVIGTCMSMGRRGRAAMPPSTNFAPGS